MNYKFAIVHSNCALQSCRLLAVVLVLTLLWWDSYLTRCLLPICFIRPHSAASSGCVSPKIAKSDCIKVVHLFVRLRLCALLCAFVQACESRHCCLDAEHDRRTRHSAAGPTNDRRTKGGLDRRRRLTSYSCATKWHRINRPPQTFHPNSAAH